MNSIFRRIAAGSVLTVAPALIALGAVSTSHADTGFDYVGPSTVQTGPQQPGLRQSPVNPAPAPWTPHHRHHHHRTW